MKTKTHFLFVFMLLVFTSVKAQIIDSVFLAVPEQDTTITSYSKYRLSGGVPVGNRATLNGEEMKIYPSGAFAGLMPLEYGKNEFTILTFDKNGKQASKKFYIFRNEPLKTTSDSVLTIDSLMMEPSQNFLLQEGEYLKVKFKGTPNCKAYVFDSVEVPELSASETNGLDGVYQAYVKMKPEYFRADSLVAAKLVNKSGEEAVRTLPGKIAFLPNDYPLIGITKGYMPYLSYGLGGDRLGGAKMGYITEGIKLKITGKIGSAYRVQLTDDNEAWISDEFVDLQPFGKVPSHILTGSWKVSGDDKYDYVYVGLSERVPYYSYQEINPNKIIVDLYGPVSNSNWITQLRNTKEVKDVYYVQPSKDLFRVIIELKSKQSWGYSISYSGSSLLIKVKHTPEKLKIGKLKFAIDAGHGGENLGALGSTGAHEKNVTLSIARYLKEALEDEGASVYMTRSKDTLVSNGERLKGVLENSGADMIVSIHCNSLGEASNPENVKGTSVYYKHIIFKPLSTFIYDEMLKLDLKEFGQIGSFNFTLNSPTDIPNVLVETAFISNPEDEMKLLDDDFRKEIAEKIVKGIEEFLDYCDE